ncbi:DNA polymerase ligase N-terminal domain-containing protein [Kaistella sp. PBT33-4]|nr:DNA polymerase ligase N-terminal domain-containing protein [Kaistella sp. PBT33-4]MDF0719657.1 DNA polymerase ligase N-terminal domain-containing protein [Kaistella sp. PBT33-4]
MALEEYRKKRSKEKTPEPFGGKSTGKELHFVVQKHDASHLHYDFRLEMDGVLKSWAVPKGPSLDPSVKRLAMMVEDHPFDYRNFEGAIPKGQYGGGTVIVWDEGTYLPAEPAKSRKKQEQQLLKQLKAGKIKFTLNGTKLKGEFALVKAHGRGDNGWLLMKLNDKYADTEDVTLKDRSVLSDKTIAEMEEAPVEVYGQKDSKKAKAKNASKTSKKKTAETEKSKPAVKKPAKSVEKLLAKAPKQPFYTELAPMLATLVDKPFDSDEWLYEIKWDGYRAVAFMNNGAVTLKSRNNKSFSEKFYPVQE